MQLEFVLRGFLMTNIFRGGAGSKVGFRHICS